MYGKVDVIDPSMDRTEEFARIVSIFSSPNASGDPAPTVLPISAYMNLAQRVASLLDSCESLVSKISLLADRKEFSNDPTTAMAEISHQFQEIVASVQTELARMKNISDVASSSSSSLHQHQQHHKLLSQGLQKRLAGYVDIFQNAVKTHTAHVQARNRRVDRYGVSNTSVPVIAPNSSAPGFAMFQAPNREALVQVTPLKNPNMKVVPQMNAQMTSIAPDVGKSLSVMTGASDGAELRKRTQHNLVTSAPVSNPFVSSSSGYAYTQRRTVPEAYAAGGHLSEDHDDPQAKSLKLQQHRGLNTARLRGAEKVEAAIAQMGSLFTQMAGLVMEQGETLARIEDDIESGLEQTVAAHAEMQYFYDISKGNRALIVKILLLLAFFAILFLRWL